MNAPFVELERLTLVAPLGLRFWDVATHTPVRGGLIVTAYPTTSPQRRIRAFATPSGVYVLRDLPGLRRFENGTGDEPFWASPPTQLPFEVEVVDQERRFLPCTFTANAPQQGLFMLDCAPIPVPGQPGVMLEAVPLYSAPTRIVPSGMAAIRAEIRLKGTAGIRDTLDKPAPWARLEATIKNFPVVLGFADARGQALLIFPYPEPTQLSNASTFSPPGSPAGGVGLKSLLEQEWPSQITAFFTSAQPPPVMLDMCSALHQPSADISGGAADRTLSAALRYGQELRVMSPGESALLIEPG